MLNKIRKRGNCYVASEALYHLLGGKSAGWLPCVMQFGSDTHWFLRHKPTGLVLDPTVAQFGGRTPDYTKGRGTGFLTREPSKRAGELMNNIVWQEDK